MERTLIAVFLGSICAAMVAGIGLAIYYDNFAWLLISGVAFIILYAG